TYRFAATGLTLLPGPGLLPLWEMDFVVQGVVLFAGTMTLLLLPKLLALIDLWRDRAEWAAFGGGWRLGAGVVLETLVFTLIAPVLMMFHCKFVLKVMSGQGVQWVT